jgi:hypothetical protein
LSVEEDREAPSAAEPGSALAAELDAALRAAPAAAPLDWPRCGYCGSTALRESRRGGFKTRLLRFAGCTVYRCENCERRFAFSALGHPERHKPGAKVSLRRRRENLQEDHVVVGERRRFVGLLAMILAAIFTFLAAAWLISRAERRRLEGEGGSPPQ